MIEKASPRLKPVNNSFDLKPCLHGDIRLPNGDRYRLLFGREYNIDFVDIRDLLMELENLEAAYLA